MHQVIDNINEIKKTLVFRLSSLGDLILSTAYLESCSKEGTIDWVISDTFEFVLRGHPRISRLYTFDKKQGLLGWVRLVIRLAHSGQYNQVVDLHRTLRTTIARILFFFLSDAKFICISKQRLRGIGLLIAKRFWPKAWLPDPYWKRFALAAAPVDGQAQPPRFPLQGVHATAAPLFEQPYLCIMPASRWRSKEWSAAHYETVCEHILSRGGRLVLLGRSSDELSVGLLKRFQSHPQFLSLLDEPDFHRTAVVLKHAAACLSADTGLAHLAEAMGTRAFMLFGPTQPELGFGPWKENSFAFSARVACSPCSKDGRICYRINDPYACLSRILPATVLSKLQQEGLVPS